MRKGVTLQVGKSADSMVAGFLILNIMIVTCEGRGYSTGGLECRHDGDRMFDTSHYDSQQ